MRALGMKYVLMVHLPDAAPVDGDPAAAMRYTEVRMHRLASELLADIDKETVDFTPNYDESEHEPAVLPARFPNLLVNGSSGIAVGMATNIPPHNLTEVIDGCVRLIEQPDVTAEELMEIIPGPDFPTAGIINGVRGVREAYRTGRAESRRDLLPLVLDLANPSPGLGFEGRERSTLEARGPADALLALALVAARAGAAVVLKDFFRDINPTLR